MEDNSNTNKRHGCVTAWLIFILIANAASALMYLILGDDIIPRGTPNAMIWILILFGVANVAFAVMLFQWKKLGFWGFIITSIGAFIANVSMGLGIGTALFGLVGVVVLYGVLQIKRDNASAWSNLK